MLSEGSRKSQDEIVKRKTMMANDILKIESKSVAVPPE